MIKKKYLVSSNLFFPSVLIAILLSDIHFIPGNREVELLILALIGIKIIFGYKVSFLLPRSFHEYVFLIFIAYMCINVVMSMVVNSVSFHWLLYFLMFLPLMSEAKKDYKLGHSKKNKYDKFDSKISINLCNNWFNFKSDRS